MCDYYGFMFFFLGWYDSIIGNIFYFDFILFKNIWDKCFIKLVLDKKLDMNYGKGIIFERYFLIFIFIYWYSDVKEFYLVFWRYIL